MKTSDFVLGTAFLATFAGVAFAATNLPKPEPVRDNSKYCAIVELHKATAHLPLEQQQGHEAWLPEEICQD